MNKDVMKHAMIDYARDCYRRGDNTYTADQWVSIMNGYAGHLAPEECARRAGITSLEASLLYCRFSIILTEAALTESRDSVLTSC